MMYRVARVTDIPALCRITTAQPYAAPWTAEQWQAELAGPASYTLCAEEGDVVGFISLRLAADVCEIVNVAVDPAQVRRGIGTELLSRALAWVDAHGGKQITLEVNAGNTAAVRLYQRAGFKRLGVRKKFYHGTEDALIMGFNK